ncbi:hypothetical protein [Pseudomonas brassicacearum]|jgi:hypothetical protein|uniref:Uncharacterized protein n=1 Tax=Pseudomonas brassicacearum subsp. neoaurantiaca TaxID=494916 RepID=A0A7V8RN15_9PSED|nr:hypothetical protein [Pseudomonas brassicacearum]MBA1379518.1 hypothetical protein [Pseudomonas brassicacearum subsp. neoaurantiaca]
MTDRINEQSVERAAREWATRSSNNEQMVVTSAYETMAALKGSLAPAQYETALRDLYNQYNQQ